MLTGPVARLLLVVGLLTMSGVLLGQSDTSTNAGTVRSCGSDLTDPGGCNSSGAASDVGSAAPRLMPSTSVGNPLDLITGNKFQREVDYAIPGHELVFNRHYNSLNADWNIGIGQGWHHT